MPRDKNSYHIFVIEDNEGDYMLIADYLEEHIVNPTVTHAKNYKEATDLFTRHTKVDIVLMDLSLPDKSGESLIADALQFFGKCPIIILTGYTDLRFSIHSLSLGISDYLLKDDITSQSLYKSVVYSIERKKTLLALSESEKRYSDLFHLSPQPMWVQQTETGLFLDVNDAAIRHYGYSRKDFLKLSVNNIRADVPLHENTSATVRSLERVSNQQYARHKKKNGEILVAQIKSDTINYNGQSAEVILVNDITELLSVQQSLRNAYKSVVDIEEQERQRLAGELHDGIAQNLVAMQLIFSNLAKKFPDINSHHDTAFLNEILLNTVRECRDVVNNVRPKELIDAGLDSMLTQMLEKMNNIGKVKLFMDMKTSLDEHFEYADKFHLYRILQENINNMLKHSEATEAKIIAEKKDNSIHLLFSDNGKGIKNKILRRDSSFIGIKRRMSVLNGKLSIINNRPKGVTFEYIFPLA